jgi:hypothetical protein
VENQKARSPSTAVKLLKIRILLLLGETGRIIFDALKEKNLVGMLEHATLPRIVESRHVSWIRSA